MWIYGTQSSVDGTGGRAQAAGALLQKPTDKADGISIQLLRTSFRQKLVQQHIWILAF
jgi:hypothetical protein